MIGDDALVELAEDCVRAYHVLKGATEGRGADSLSVSGLKAVEDFGRYVDPAHSFVDGNERYQNHAQHQVHCQRA